MTGADSYVLRAAGRACKACPTLTFVVAALALLSSIMWGTSDFLGGTLARKRPPLAIVGVGQVAGLVVMVMVVLATQAWDAPIGYAAWAVLAAACGMLGLWAFYSALAMGTMGIVSPIAATGIVVPLLGGLLTGDVPSLLQAVGIVVAIAGMVSVMLPRKRDLASREPDRSAHTKSVALAGFAALMFGTSLAAIAQGSLVSAVMTMTTMRVFSVIVLGIVALAMRSFGGMTWQDMPMAVTVGVLDVGANLMYGLSAASGQLVIAAVLGSLYPVVTVLLAWQIQHERLSRLQYAGIALAMLGVVLMSAS